MAHRRQDSLGPGVFARLQHRADQHLRYKHWLSDSREETARSATRSVAHEGISHSHSEAEPMNWKGWVNSIRLVVIGAAFFFAYRRMQQRQQKQESARNQTQSSQ